MPTINDLRAVVGSSAAGRSDEELLDSYARVTGRSPLDVAREFNYKPSDNGQWGNRLSGSIDNYQSNLYGFAEALGAGDWARRGRVSNEFEANVAREAARNQGAVQSFRDIDGVGSALNYVGGLAVDSLPYLGEAAVGGLAGRAVMGGTRAALAAARTQGLPTAVQAAQTTLNRASLTGAAAAGYPSGVGDILSAQRDQTGTTDPASAFALGVPYTALGVVGLEAPLARGALYRNTRQALDEAGGFTGGLKRAGYTALTTGAKESASETGQEFINQIGRNQVDPNAGYFGPEAVDRYAESAVGGALLGGSVSTALGGWRRSEGYQAPAADPNESQDLLNKPAGGLPPPPLQLSWDGYFQKGEGQKPFYVFPDGSTATSEDAAIEQRFQMPDGTLADIRNTAGPRVDPRMDTGNTAPYLPNVMVADEGGMVATNAKDAESLYGRDDGDPGLALARERYVQQKRAADDRARLAEEVARKNAEFEAAKTRATEVIGGKIGDRHVKLFRELERQRDAGLLTDNDFTDDAALLSRNKLGEVERNIKKRDEQAATQPNVAKPTGVAAGAPAGGSVDTGRGVGSVGSVAPDAAGGNAAAAAAPQQGVADAVPVGDGPRVDGDGAVAAPMSREELSGAARSFRADFDELEPQTRDIVLAWLGVDNNFEEVEEPKTLAEISRTYVADDGRVGVSRQAIDKALRKFLKASGMPEDLTPEQVRARFLAPEDLSIVNRFTDGPTKVKGTSVNSEDNSPALSDEGGDAGSIDVLDQRAVEVEAEDGGVEAQPVDESGESDAGTDEEASDVDMADLADRRREEMSALNQEATGARTRLEVLLEREITRGDVDDTIIDGARQDWEDQRLDEDTAWDDLIDTTKAAWVRAYSTGNNTAENQERLLGQDREARVGRTGEVAVPRASVDDGGRAGRLGEGSADAGQARGNSTPVGNRQEVQGNRGADQGPARGAQDAVTERATPAPLLRPTVSATPGATVGPAPIVVEAGPRVNASVLPASKESKREKRNAPVDDKWAQDHAKDTGGAVVFNDGEVALVRGFAALSGQHVYVGVHRGEGTRTRLDVRAFEGELFTPEQLAKLRAEADRLEAEDARLHEQNPDGPFQGSEPVAATESIPQQAIDYVRGLLNTLNLRGVRVFLVTPKDVGTQEAKDRYKLYGKMSSAMSASLDPNEDGSVRRFGSKNTDFYISMKLGMDSARTVETLAHEVGHIVERLAYQNADAATKAEVRKEYEAWLQRVKGLSAEQLVHELRNAATAEAHAANMRGPATDLTPYWTSFGEWFADNVSRWATTADKPVSLLDKFFQRVVEAYRKIAASVTGRKYVPNKAVADFLNRMADTPSETPWAPTDERASQSTADPNGDGVTLPESETTRVTANRFFESDSAKAAVTRLQRLGLGDIPTWVKGGWFFAPETSAAGKRVADGWVWANDQGLTLTVRQPFTEGSGTWTIVHELAHIADMAPFGGIYSADPRMQRGGSVYEELVALSEGSDTWNKVFEYPLAYGYEADVEAGEMFAQLFAAYASPGLRPQLEAVAPEATKFMKEVVRAIRSESTPTGDLAQVATARRQAFLGTASGGRQAGQSAVRGQSRSGRADQGRQGVSRSVGAAKAAAAEKSANAGTNPSRTAIADIPAPRARAGGLKGLVDSLATDGLWRTFPSLLGWLSGEQLADRFKGDDNIRGPVKAFSDLSARMAGRATQIMASSDAIRTRWDTLRRKNAMAHERLSQLLMRSTALQMWPNAGFRDKQNMHLEDTPENRAEHAKLAEMYRTAPAEVQALYRDVLADFDSRFKTKTSALRRSVVETYYPDAQSDGLGLSKAEVDRAAAGRSSERAKLLEELGTTKRRAKELKHLWSDLDRFDVDFKSMPGPYFPMMRFGKHIVTVKSEAYVQAEQVLEKACAALRNAENTAKADDSLDEEREAVKTAAQALARVKADGNQYRVEFFETLGEARDYREQLKDLKGYLVEQSIKDEYLRQVDAVSPTFMRRIEAKLGQHLNGKDADKVKQAVREMYIHMLPDQHALKSQLRRANVAGASTDALRAYAAASMRDAYSISRMEYQTPMREALDELRFSRDVDAKIVGQEMAKRLQMNFQYEEHPVLSALSNGTYLTYLGLSPSFLMTQVTQPWLISAPILAARHNMKAFGELKEATKVAATVLRADWKKQGTFAFQFDPQRALKAGQITQDEAVMLQDMLDSGRIDITITQDLGVTADGKDNNWLSRVTQLAGRPAQQIEVMNRVATALAAYRLERQMQQSKNQTGPAALEAARDYAAKVIGETHLNYAAENRARHMHPNTWGGWGRIMWQFRSYQQGMLYLVFKNLLDSTRGDKEARKASAYLAGSMLASAGVTGLPGAAAAFFVAQAIYNAFTDDDDEKDVKQMMYAGIEQAAGESVANLFMKGAPTLAGIDLSGRVGMGDITSPARYVDDRKEGKDLLSAYWVAMTGGASFSMVANWAEAIKHAGDGDFAKAAQTALPKVVADQVRWMREQTGGVTDARGRVLVTPEERDFLDGLARAAGLPTVEDARRTERRGAFFAARENRDTARQKLLTEFAQARIAGKPVTDILTDIQSFNERHPDARITPAQREAAVQKSRQSAKELRGGVPVRKRDQELADELGI